MLEQIEIDSGEISPTHEKQRKKIVGVHSSNHASKRQSSLSARNQMVPSRKTFVNDPLQKQNQLLSVEDEVAHKNPRKTFQCQSSSSEGARKESVIEGHKHTSDVS